MANESTQVYTEYEDALNAQKIQYKTIGADGTATYIDATAANLTTFNPVSNPDKQRFIKNSSEQLLISSNIANALNSSYAEISYWKTTHPGFTNDDGSDIRSLDYNSYKDITKEQLLNDVTFQMFVIDAEGRRGDNGSVWYTTWDQMKADSSFSGKLVYYENLYLEMLKNGHETVSDSNMNSSNWLQSQIDGGNIFLYEYNSTGGTEGPGGYTDTVETNVATNTNLQEVSDETGMKKAEAKYESSMAKIDAKDKKFDTDIATLDTERNAIKTEIDTLKTVAKDNVDRTFKLFS